MINKEQVRIHIQKLILVRNLQQDWSILKYQAFDLGLHKAPLLETGMIQETEAKLTPKAIVWLQLCKLKNSRFISDFLPEEATNYVLHKSKLFSDTKGETLENHLNKRCLDSMEQITEEENRNKKISRRPNRMKNSVEVTQ